MTVSCVVCWLLIQYLDFLLAYIFWILLRLRITIGRQITYFLSIVWISNSFYIGLILIYDATDANSGELWKTHLVVDLGSHPDPVVSFRGELGILLFWLHNLINLISKNYELSKNLYDYDFVKFGSFINKFIVIKLQNFISFLKVN